MLSLANGVPIFVLPKLSYIIYEKRGCSTLIKTRPLIMLYIAIQISLIRHTMFIIKMQIAIPVNNNSFLLTSSVPWNIRLTIVSILCFISLCF